MYTKPEIIKIVPLNVQQAFKNYCEPCRGK